MNSRNEPDPDLPGWCRTVLSEHEGPGTESLPIGIVTYGSLLHPDEVQTLFGVPETDQVRVKVNGYRRRFNKHIAEHLYRETEREKRAVLNIERSTQHWFNGLVLGPIEPTDFKQYAFREREYELQKLDPSSLDFYSNQSGTILEQLDEVYTCLLDEELSRGEPLEPVPGYLDLCLEGATRQGGQFGHDFKRTTWVRGMRLTNYLSRD